MMRCHNETKRGFVLLAVLVIVGSALLVVTGLVYFAQSEASGQHVSRVHAQRSISVHSALNVIVPRLDQQRDRILEGELPELDEQYELHENNGRLMVARLQPLREGGPLLAPEAGKLDLNAVDVEQLVATGLFGMATAERIVMFREESLGRPFQSVAELLHVDGVTPEMLYGPLDELSITPHPPDDGAQRFNTPMADVANSAADILTVFAFEPALQRDGRRRISLNVEWSEELADRLDNRFGEGAAQTVKGIIDSGIAFDDESVIYAVLNQFEVPLEDWPEFIDAITTEEGEYHFGRLNINTASEQALLGLPTIEPEQASEIVQTREELDNDEQATIAWPALHHILDRQQYESLGGLMTTRSWTYRMRFIIGEVNPEEPDGPIDVGIICEAVIDLSAPKARIAYLRDVTMLDLAARITVRDGLIDAEADGASEFGSQPDEPPADDTAGAAPDEWRVGELDPIADPMANDETAGEPEEPNTGPARRRIGRWRGG